MATWILALGWIAFAGLASGAVGFAITSLYERSWRATGVAALLFPPLLGLFAALLLLDVSVRPWVVLALVVLGTLGGLLVTLPVGSNPSIRIPLKQGRIDEREAILHRFYRLESGMPEFDEYYRDHPEKLEFDEQVRSLPQLADPGSQTYHRLASPFQAAAFEALEGITRDIEWRPCPIEAAPVQAAPEEFSRRLKGFARYLGADLVGTTRLNPAYVYSHIGRSPGTWGARITLDHSHALAIGVEMSHDMVRHAPDSATTTETAFKYFEAAKIAMLVARYINLLGYEARAHVDGNYRVMCGPIAADAGLGELGRLGLLISPTFGPRLRLSVVTTNLPLTQDEPVCFGVQHFCHLCRKCATCCPSGAIDSGQKAIYQGVEKWQTNQESCYRFWRVQGSDCAICVKVCPYSHPNTPMHNLVRWTVRRNALARRLAVLADDLFYGRRASGRYHLPDWHTKG